MHFHWLSCQADDDHYGKFELAMNVNAALRCCEETVLEGRVMAHRYGDKGCYIEAVLERDMTVLSKDELKLYERDVAEA
eukprot:171107-Pyramimonas_sp.AAC.1